MRTTSSPTPRPEMSLIGRARAETGEEDQVEDLLPRQPVAAADDPARQGLVEDLLEIDPRAVVAARG